MNTRSVIVVFCTIFVAFAIVLLVAGVLSTEEATKEGNSNSEVVTDNSGDAPTEWTARVNDVAFSYEVVDSVDMEGVPAGNYPYYYVWDDDSEVCRVQFTSEFLRETETSELVFGVGTGVAYCGAIAKLSSDWVQSPWGGFEDLPTYTDAWLEEYREQCGNRLQPLGWEPEGDGTCEIPDLSQVEP